MPVPEEHRATSRVLDILELLARADQCGYTLTEIAQAISAPKSSISPILHTMNARRFIQLDQATGSYKIGLAAFTVGSVFAARHTLLEHIRNEMRNITQSCGEICQMGVPEKNQVLYVAKEDTPNPIQLSSYVGKRFPMYCTALGKAFMMEYSPEHRGELYPDSSEMKALTPYTITDRDTLFRQLDEMHQSGFAVEIGESAESICCIAVPLNARGVPVAALSVSIPVFRKDAEKMELVKRILSEARKSIELLFQEPEFSSELDSFKEIF